MSAEQPVEFSRRFELQSDRALAGLAPLESAEWIALGADSADFDEFERAAAALDLGLFPASKAGELSTELRERILVSAGLAMAAAPQLGSRPQALAPTRSIARSASNWGWLAAAALLIAAVAGWWPRGGERDEQDPARLLACLEREDPELMHLDWAALPDPAAKGARGAVYWSAQRQEGYMKIEGLAPNDPRVEQYQLWIFDAERPAETPVDGGVFDMPRGDGVLAIHAALAVHKAAAFAITVEKPGGVVVSKRERIVLLAKGA